VLVAPVVLAVVAMAAEDDSICSMRSMPHSVDERAAARLVAQLPYAVVVVAVEVAVEHFDYSNSVVATAPETTHQMTERTHRPNRVVAEAAA
jgi:hypothetical protein